MMIVDAHEAGELSKANAHKLEPDIESDEVVIYLAQISALIRHRAEQGYNSVQDIWGAENTYKRPDNPIRIKVEKGLRERGFHVLQTGDILDGLMVKKVIWDEN